MALGTRRHARSEEQTKLSTDEKIEILWRKEKRSPFKNPLVQFPVAAALFTILAGMVVPMYMENASVPAWIHKTFLQTNAALYWSLNQSHTDPAIRGDEEYSSSLHSMMSKMIEQRSISTKEEILDGLHHIYSGSHVFAYTRVVDSSIACRLAADPSSAELLGIANNVATKTCSEAIYPDNVVSIEPQMLSANTADEIEQFQDRPTGKSNQSTQFQDRLAGSYVDFSRQWSLPVLAPGGAVLRVWAVARRSDERAGQSLLDYYVDESSDGQPVPTTVGSSRSEFFVQLNGSALSTAQSLHFITFRLNGMGDEFMNNRNTLSDPFLLLDVFIEVIATSP